MKRVLVPLATGFEEIEAVTAIDVLRRAGAEVVVAGLEEGPIEGSRGVRVLPDTTLEELGARSFDLVALPGGMPGARNLRESRRIQELLRGTHAGGGVVAAICAAPVVLEASGLLGSVRATSHPSVKDRLRPKAYSTERVVVDGRVVTSRGPGTAMEFALKLVEMLFGAEKVRELEDAMILEGGGDPGAR